MAARDRQLAAAGRAELGFAQRDEALVAYRMLLQHSPLAEQIERVVSFGHATLSRPVTQLLSRTDIEIVHVGTQETFPVPGRHERDVRRRGRRSRRRA